MESYVLWLISLDIKNSVKIKLIKKYGNEKIIFSKFDDICGIEGISYIQYKKSLENKIVRSIKEDRENGIDFITILDARYPEKLRQISNPPYVIFYKGNIDLLNKEAIAVVGSRRHSLYGEQVTKLAATQITNFNFVLVSGGAKGVDSIAHREVVKKGGETIVVLGSGLNVLYPKQNILLFQEVIQNNGLIISEFLSDTSPLSVNFPRRNRVISGLCDKIIVAEASVKSGSLITVSHALDQGKDVGVFPTTFFSKSGYGCNMLIKDGAAIIASVECLFQFLGVENQKKIKQNSIIQNEILNIIKDEPTHIDNIFEKSNVDRNTLYRLLFEMQIKNQIVSLPGNYYARII